MAATVSVKEINGASSGTATTVTNVRHHAGDAYNPGTNNPVQRPASGNNFSFWKTLYLNADTAPTGTINNVKVYTDGTIGWTGMTKKFGVKNGYTQATGTTGVTGNDAATALSITMTDSASYTSGSPLSMSGSITATTGRITTDNLISQVTVSTTAGLGVSATETTTFQYDET